MEWLEAEGDYLSAEELIDTPRNVAVAKVEHQTQAVVGKDATDSLADALDAKVALVTPLNVEATAFGFDDTKEDSSPKKAPTAFLLDIDGTLVQTDDLYFLAFKRLLTPHGFDVNDEWYEDNVHGRADKQVFTSLFPRFNAEQIAEMGVKKDQAFCALYHEKVRAEGVDSVMLKGLSEALTLAKKLGVIAIAVTNAPRGAAEAVIASLRAAIPAADIIHPTIIIGAECTVTKPHPEPYLKGAAIIGVPPEECVVFEDSGSGVRAGVACGARAVVGMMSNLGEDKLRGYGASHVVKDWTQVDAKMLMKLAE